MGFIVVDTSCAWYSYSSYNSFMDSSEWNIMNKEKIIKEIFEIEENEELKEVYENMNVETLLIRLKMIKARYHVEM